MRFALVAVAMIAASCAGKKDRAPEVTVGQRSPTASPQVALPAGPPPFPEGTHSLELVRTVGVRLEPADDAKRIGTVAIDTRVGWIQVQHGRGCDKPWVEIRPRGWVCGDYIKASTKPPYGQEVPQLDRGEIVPGIYGKVTVPGSVTFTLAKPEKTKKPTKKTGPVRSPNDLDDDDPAAKLAKMPTMIEDAPIIGSLNVRQYDVLDVGGKTYWKIAQKDNQYVLASAISKHQPSRFSGARLGDDTGLAVPIAFAWPRGGGQVAWVTAKSTGAGAVRQIRQRTLVPILEVATDLHGKPSAYRIAPGEWLSALDVRVFQPTAPPAGLGPHERWIDVDLDTQILVAFEGDEAVYATMVSTGAKDTPTEPGIYRMWMKESEADMKGLNGEDPYSVATVPWTQFFSPENGLALHTAYWHDGFGRPRSHGCVNLAPRDARWLYFWSDPQVPPGWTMAAGVVEAPGSIVRIRSAVDPTPELKGYAKKVAQQRP
ncbi:MAG: L,D-transpeptidase family protein [Kofleriaceae bacterium]